MVIENTNFFLISLGVNSSSVTENLSSLLKKQSFGVSNLACY